MAPIIENKENIHEKEFSCHELGHSLHNFTKKNYNKTLEKKRMSTNMNQVHNFPTLKPSLRQRYNDENANLQHEHFSNKGMSTIEMLKKQVRLLQQDDYQNEEVHRYQRDKTQNTEAKCFLQLTKFKRSKCRKVARGRPENYNLTKKLIKAPHQSTQPSINAKATIDLCQRGTFIERLQKLQEIKYRSRSYHLKQNLKNEENTLKKRIQTQF